MADPKSPGPGWYDQKFTPTQRFSFSKEKKPECKSKSLWFYWYVVFRIAKVPGPAEYFSNLDPNQSVLKNVSSFKSVQATKI